MWTRTAALVTSATCMLSAGAVVGTCPGPLAQVCPALRAVYSRVGEDSSSSVSTNSTVFRGKFFLRF